MDILRADGKVLKLAGDVIPLSLVGDDDVHLFVPVQGLHHRQPHAFEL